MKKWYDEEGYGICSKTMMMLYPLMEAVRSGGDLMNLGGDGSIPRPSSVLTDALYLN